MRGGLSALERGITYEQAVRVWRLAELIRGHRLGLDDRTVKLIFQDGRLRPWDDIAESQADGTAVGWQVKDLSEPLPEGTLRDLLAKLRDDEHLHGVLALSHPILGGGGIPVTALRDLSDTARTAAGDIGRWDLRDKTEQQHIDAIAMLTYGDGEGATTDAFRLLARLRVQFLGTRAELLRRAVDTLGRFFREPEEVVARLHECVLTDGVRGVVIDHDLLEERALVGFAELVFDPPAVPPAVSTEPEFLLWTSDARGVARTLWLSGTGHVRAEAPTVIVATRAHAWKLGELRIPVPMLQCDPFDDFDHDNPPVEVKTVRAAELRDLYTGATVPLSLITAGQYPWMIDALQEVTLMGGIDSLFLVRLHLWLDGGGAHPMYETAFRALDLARGGREVPLWSDDEAQHWEAGIGLAAVNAMRPVRCPNEVAPFETCKLTQAALRIDNDMRVRTRLQFTADVCHADADGTWDDYSASQLVDNDELPSRLRGSATPPDPILRYWTTNPLPGVAAGWSRAPDSKERREALWAAFQPS